MNDRTRVVAPPAHESRRNATRSASPPVASSQRLGNENMQAVLRDTVQREADPASLSENDQRRVDYLWRKSMEMLGEIGRAQNAHHSLLRSQWMTFFYEEVLGRIPELESEPHKIAGVADRLQRQLNAIDASVARYRAEWQALERRYLDERDWLLRQRSDDATQSARQLEQWYGESKHWLQSGAAAYITDEDYALLKSRLEQGGHVAVGTLRASRARVQQLEEMLDVVADLRIDGDDAEKYVPGWQTHVQTEADYLERLAQRTAATTGFDYPAEFTRLRSELLAKRDATLKTQKRERPALGKVIDFVSGAAEAIVGPLVEAAKQAYDLAQIGVHFASFGQYEPSFKSDMAKAAEQGASTADLLKGMVTGLLETPKRFVEAVEKGDWEAIGRETANLYVLAKAIRHAPEQFRKLPELVSRTQRGLRVLRARVVGSKINQPRLLPAAPRASTATSPVTTPRPAPVPSRTLTGPVVLTRPPAHQSPVRAPVTGGQSIERPVASTRSGASQQQPQLAAGSATSNAPVPTVSSPDVKVGGFARDQGKVPAPPQANRTIRGFGRNSPDAGRDGVPVPIDNANSTTNRIGPADATPRQTAAPELPKDLKVGGFAREATRVTPVDSPDVKVGGFGRASGKVPEPPQANRKIPGFGRNPPDAVSDGVPRIQPTDPTPRSPSAPESPKDLEVGGFAREARRVTPQTEPAQKPVNGFQPPERRAGPQPAPAETTQKVPASTEAIPEHIASDPHVKPGTTAVKVDTRDAVPQRIDDGQKTARNEDRPAAPNAKIEQIGPFKVFGTKHLDSNLVWHRRIGAIANKDGPTADIGPIRSLMAELYTEAQTAGARTLKATLEFIENPNVFKIRRFVETFGGTVRQIDAITVEIVIPVTKK